MTDTTHLDCRVQGRRQKLFGNSSWNGIDFVEMSADQLSLCVHFFGNLPAGIVPANIRIQGGRRILGIRATDVHPEPAHDDDLDDCLHVTLSKSGDFSIYRICLVNRDGGPFTGLDPRYACAEFSFKTDCASDIDCKVEDTCLTESVDSPVINYLAKDYASFRQLIYDRLSLIMPDWRERHAPDLGVTLVEILAYAADHLSYYQDAVATEAYLETARLRTSIRRHLQLIGYTMHEGLNARVLVSVWVSNDITFSEAEKFYFITGFEGIEVSNSNIVNEDYLAKIPCGYYEVFEPDKISHPAKIGFYAAHNKIQIYTWGDEECCLPRGAMRATLLDQDEDVRDGARRILNLSVGDIIIFEEVVGATSGLAEDADINHRHAVRLVRWTASEDALLGKLVLEIEWAEEDALPFSLCLSSRRKAPDCNMIRNISVARGNVIVASHGRRVKEELGPVGEGIALADCACEGSVVEAHIETEDFKPVLNQRPLVFADAVQPGAAVSRLFARNPQNAIPQILLNEKSNGAVWSARSSLMESAGDSRHFVTETDDESLTHLRFGNGEFGRKPEAGASFIACYRVGNGKAGNVDHDTITYFVSRGAVLSGTTFRPRNPMAARGGEEPESAAEARLIAPGKLRSQRERAITAADYAEFAVRNPKLQGAAADLRWTGSWREAQVAIDPFHSDTVDPALMNDVVAALAPYRRMGHDISVIAARYVPIKLSLEVCVLPHHAHAAVRRALRLAFGTTPHVGFFDPDRLVFGGGVRLSAIVAAVHRIEGVQAVKISRLERISAPSERFPETGILTMGAEEIAQLDSDPNFPENGTLELNLRGGR